MGVILLLIFLAIVLVVWAWLPQKSSSAPALSPAPEQPLVDRIDDLLPQTQCGKCGFGGCRPYAETMARGEAPINRCPPGGEKGIAALAELLNTPILPLDPECGEETPLHVAFIVEDLCIGCTKCIQACPVDAIVGASKRMHTIIADRCTGCELCVPACPVDCIDMIPAPSDHPSLGTRPPQDAPPNSPM